MAEPTLGEILSVRPDSSVATGQPAVVYDTQKMVDSLGQAARFKAENDWRKYMNFQNNLKEVYKDVEKIQEQETLTEDRPYLQKQATEIFSQIMKDPKAVYNPDLQQKIGKLRAETIESKQNKLFDISHREFINRNPELNTDSNKQRINEFIKQPLGQRQAYSLDMPTIFDAQSYKNTIITHPAVKTAFATSEVTPDQQFIKEVSGNKYDRKKFLQAWNTGLKTQSDKYGHSIEGAAKQMFGQLSDEDKDYWNKNGGIEAFWNHLGEMSFGGDGDIIETVKDNLQANPNYINPEELALKKAKVAQDWKALGLKERELDKADDEDLLGADSIIGEISDAISKGDKRIIQNKQTGKTKEVLEIGDPNLLKTFGTIDKDGNVTNTPDKIWYDPEKNQLTLNYYKINEETGKPEGSTSTGIVFDETKTKTVNPTQWIGGITKNKFPNKNIGTINTLVEQVYNKSGRNLVSLSEMYLGKGKAKEQAAPSGGFDRSKSYNVGGKTYSGAQIEAAAAKSGGTPEQYLKALGIK